MLLGNGDASFSPKAAYQLDNLANYEKSLDYSGADRAGDFNGDGKLDVRRLPVT